MRTALVVKEVRYDGDESANLYDIAALTHQSADAGANLVLFPEYAASLGENTDDPSHDRSISRPIPGRATEQLGEIARNASVYLGIGLLERDVNCIYDTAVLFDSNGDLTLMYRRNSPGWHGRNADPVIYCQGSDFPVVKTRWGSMAIAICGDLFDDSFVNRIRAVEPRYLLWPIARCFNDGSFDQWRWDREEEPQYLERARLTGCTPLMVNKLGDRSREECPSFGGALVVSPRGQVVARWPLGRRGILHVDI